MNNINTVMSYFREVYPFPTHPLSLTLNFFPTYELVNSAKEDLTEIYSKKNVFFTHFNICVSVNPVSLTKVR